MVEENLKLFKNESNAKKLPKNGTKSAKLFKI